MSSVHKFFSHRKAHPTNTTHSGYDNYTQHAIPCVSHHASSPEWYSRKENLNK